jgi:hypothetical protein
MAKRLRIVKRGDYVYMSLAKAAGDDPQFAGGWIKIPLQGTFYVGIGLCSHDKDVVEKAVFSKVTLQYLYPTVAASTFKLHSTLESVAIASAVRQVAYTEAGRVKSANWTPDGASFIFNKVDRVEEIPITGGTPRGFSTPDLSSTQPLTMAYPLMRSGSASPTNPPQEAMAPRSTLFPSKEARRAAGYNQFAVVLAWLVAGRKDAGFRGTTQRQSRRGLYHTRSWRRGNTADDGPKYKRHTRIFAGRKVHLFQLQPHRAFANLAHETRWEQSGAGFRR